MGKISRVARLLVVFSMLLQFSSPAIVLAQDDILPWPGYHQDSAATGFADSEFTLAPPLEDA